VVVLVTITDDDRAWCVLDTAPTPHASPAGGRLHGVDQAEAIMERGPDGAMISSTRSGDGDVCCLGKKRLVAGEALWMDRDTKEGIN